MKEKNQKRKRKLLISFERPLKELFAMEKQSITIDYNLNLQVGDTLRMYAR